MVVGISVSKRVVLVLVMILLMGTTLFDPNCRSARYQPDTIDESETIDIANVNPNQDAPTMRYYLRRYGNFFSSSFPNFTVTIFVEDPDGVDTVVMMVSQETSDSDNSFTSAQDTGVWQNLSMEYTENNWYQATISIPNLTNCSSWCSFHVIYTANDTLGNSQVSPLCIYSFSNCPQTVDWFSIELYDTPDLWYVVGTTNHTISWDVAPDMHGQSGWPYRLYEDGNLTEYWIWSNKIIIDVDGLDIGDHTFEINLQVVSSNNKDTVTVHVVNTPEEIPLGVPTISVGPITGLDGEPPNLMAPIIILVVSLVVIIIFWKKRKT